MPFAPTFFIKCQSSVISFHFSPPLLTLKEMELLDGKKAATKVQEDIAKEVAYLKEKGHRAPH